MKMRHSIRSEPNFSTGEGIRQQCNALNFKVFVLAVHSCRVEGSRAEAAGIMLEFIATC